MSVLVLVAAIAATQHGAVTRAQAIAAGASKAALRWAISIGELVEVAPTVYVVAGAPRTWKQQLMVAVLDAGPGACVSHRAAAVLHGVARLGAPLVVEITSPRTRTHRLAGVVVHRLLDLSDEHVMLIDGIPVTGPLRTLVDLGAVESRFEVREAVERALSMRLVTIGGLEWAVTHHSRRGRCGVGVLRWVLDERAIGRSMPDSVVEARTARVFRRYGLPMPEFQFEVRHGGLFVARVDFAYPDIREAFEINGWSPHSSQTESDYDRQHRLKAASWGVTNFTYWHVVRRPKYLADVTRSVLGAHGVVL
jgi:hypothetical protein